MKLKGYTISVVKFMDHFKNKTWLLFKCLGKKNCVQMSSKQHPITHITWTIVLLLEL